MNTKNVSLRFGLNLNFGCRERLDINDCGCEWLRNAEKRELRNEGLRKRKIGKRQLVFTPILAKTFGWAV